MKSAPEKQSTSTVSRLGVAWLVRSFTARAIVAIIGFSISVLSVTRSAGAENAFELKTSGYFNLTPAPVLHGAGGQTGSSVGVVPEGEIELTPQYHLEGDTLFPPPLPINTHPHLGPS